MAQRGKAGDFIVLGVRGTAGRHRGGAGAGFAAVVLAGNARAASATIGAAHAGHLLLSNGTAGDYTVAPTVETEVAINVTGMIARTRVTQSFHNPGRQFVEGVYVFPLPEKAAVDHLEMRVGERVIEGEIREKPRRARPTRRRRPRAARRRWSSSSAPTSSPTQRRPHRPRRGWCA